MRTRFPIPIPTGIFLVVVPAGLFFATTCQNGTAPLPTDRVEASVHLDAPVINDSFWEHWGDGQAELIGYDLTIPRYGELRKGTAVAIFVTETFSDELRVKADPGKHTGSDEFPVMKLNLVQDFPTGIYDYNVMTSSFLALSPVNRRPAGLLTKVSLTAQEWCGHVYSQMLFDANGIRYVGHSYFDGEADEQRQLAYPADGISEDALWFWARGLAAPRLEPGDTAEVQLLTSLQHSRTSHTRPAWSPAKLSRGSSTEEVTVPGGTFVVDRWTAAITGDGSAGERSRTFFVEASPPHRIVRWEGSDGEVADMLAGERLQYWKMNGSEYASAVDRLGLQPRPARTP